MLTARSLLRHPLVFGQVFSEADDGRGVTTLGRKHPLAVTGIGGDGQIIVAAARGALVDRYGGHRR